MSYDGYTKYTYNQLEEHGNKQIREIVICRSPLADILQTAIKALEKLTYNELPYDKYYHLYALIRLEDQTLLYLEKLESGPSITKYEPRDNAEIKRERVDLKSKKFTLSEMLNNARKLVGDEKIFHYELSGANCQEFLLDCLKSMNLLNVKLLRFIKQDMQSLLNKLPGFIPAISTTATDIMNVITRTREFIGLKKGGYTSPHRGDSVFIKIKTKPFLKGKNYKIR